LRYDLEITDTENGYARWLIGTAVNLDARTTDVHVFDAGRVAAGPLVRCRACLAHPVSFHGTFVSSMRA
jgi:carotenoid cleavage dioxygenase-like enzyme